MRAIEVLVIVFAVGGASLLLGTACSVDESRGGSSGNQVTAAVHGGHGLKCDRNYCDCVRSWDWSEAKCRTYCEGGDNYWGGDAACAATAVDDPNRRCDDAYCSCIEWGTPPKQCRWNHCEGGSGYRGGDAVCFGGHHFSSDECDYGKYCACLDEGAPKQYCQDRFCDGNDPGPVCGTTTGCADPSGYCECIELGGFQGVCLSQFCGSFDATPPYCPDDPEPPACDEAAYCACINAGHPASVCREIHCDQPGVFIVCPDEPPVTCKNPVSYNTAGNFLGGYTLPAAGGSEPWQDVPDATRVNGQGASVILENGERSDFLVLHNATALDIPANAERIVSIRVMGALKASPGYAPYTAEARLVQAGSCNSPVTQSIASHEPYKHYKFVGNESGTVWGAPGGRSTLSLDEVRAPQFGVCFQMRATDGKTRAAVASAYGVVTYEVCHNTDTK